MPEPAKLTTALVEDLAVRVLDAVLGALPVAEKDVDRVEIARVIARAILASQWAEVFLGLMQIHREWACEHCHIVDLPPSFAGLTLPKCRVCGTMLIPAEIVTRREDIQAARHEGLRFLAAILRHAGLRSVRLDASEIESAGSVALEESPRDRGVFIRLER